MASEKSYNTAFNAARGSSRITRKAWQRTVHPLVGQLTSKTKVVEELLEKRAEVSGHLEDCGNDEEAREDLLAELRELDDEILTAARRKQLEAARAVVDKADSLQKHCRVPICNFPDYRVAASIVRRLG